MAVTLDSLSFVYKGDAARLEKAGFKSAGELLNRVATPEQRRVLAAEIGIDENAILDYAVMADLLRVRGMEEDVAIQLREVGVQSVQELAAADGKALYAMIVSHEKEERTTLNCSRENLDYLIEGAKGLVPRLIVHIVLEGDIDKKLEAQETREQTPRRILNGVVMAIVSISVVVILIIVVVTMLRLPQDRTFDASAKLAGIFEKYIDTLLLYWGFSLVLIVAIAILAFLAASGLWTLWGHVDRTLLRPRLFRRPVYQSTYLYMEDRELRVPLLFIAMSIVAFVILLVVLLSLINLDSVDDIFERNLDWVIIFLGCIGVVLTFAPDMWRAYMSRRKGRKLGGAAIQRYLFLRMLRAIALLAVILIFVNILVPLGFQVHRLIIHQAIVPAFYTRSETLDAELQALELVVDEDREKRVVWLKHIDEEVVTSAANLMLLKDDNGTGYEESALELVFPITFWWVLLAVVSYFIMPFVFIGKPTYAMLAIALIIVAYYVEDFVAQRVPTLFYLPAGSWSATFTILIMVFINNFVLDRLYDEVTEEPDSCLFCGLETAEGDRYCSHCGGKQVDRGPER